MIAVKELTKKYGPTEVLHGLTFSVPDGQVTGFLGPNGSGKSSTMRCILGLDTIGKGEVTFDGQPLSAYRAQRPHIAGALLEPTWYMPGHSARAHIRSIAQAAGISQSRADECLELVGLAGVQKRKIKKFSLGMKQRLGLAVALLGDPKHLILDEPVNGLDPEGVHWMRELIRRSASEGRAVLVSSHLLHEMEVTADRLVVIGKGSLIGEYTMDEFLRTGAQPTIRMRVADPDSFVDATSRLEGINLTRRPDGSLEFASEAPDLDRHLGELARDTGAVVLEMTPQRAGLEQKFLDATGQAVEYRTQDRRGQ